MYVCVFLCLCCPVLVVALRWTDSPSKKSYQCPQNSQFSDQFWREEIKGPNPSTEEQQRQRSICTDCTNWLHYCAARHLHWLHKLTALLRSEASALIAQTDCTTAQRGICTACTNWLHYCAARHLHCLHKLTALLRSEASALIAQTDCTTA
jgi:hypothetical protein